MKQIFMLIICGMMVLGCAHGSPVVPDDESTQGLSEAQTVVTEGPYRLWGEWDLYISADHERVEAVPKRTARFHMNALKFLEETCGNCLQILSVRNNYDGTIDLTIRITHPFNGYPQYTGFDVKGIIMFDGSYEYPLPEEHESVPVPGDFFRLSWKEYGDPEILNPDGYTFRWNPEWDEGSSRPILNYWPGRWSNGTPTAHINAFLNFYSHEERHMFAHDRSVTRTYHVWLPPEPIVAGYAVEACWEPPTVTPVTDPITDFPLSANQPEPYIFKMVANNNEPVTACDECCYGCDELRLFFRQWSEPLCNWETLWLPPPVSVGHTTRIIDRHKCLEPEYEGWYESYNGVSPTCIYGNGTQRFLAVIYYSMDGLSRHAYTLFDITNDDPDLD